MSALAALDPCGRPCDWLRSAYKADMLFDITGTAVPVRWYKAKAGQPWAPDGNQFVSSNWVNRDRVAGELGEQPGAMPWYNGKDFRGYPVQIADPCTMDPLLQDGFAPGGTVGPWTDGKLDCCTPAPCTCDTYPCELVATIESTSSCSSFEQSFPLSLSVSSPCTWTGTCPFWGGTAIFTLTEIADVWSCVVDCVTPFTTFTQVSFTASPFELVLDADDASLCCDFGGTGSWRITFTG